MENAVVENAAILLVEDDASLAEWISNYLMAQGFSVSIVNRGDFALSAIREQKPDLLILDVMLPGKSGFDICREIRSFFRNPIIMLTACSEEADEIVGLELGANDFLAKPVRPRVLLARIKALLRRDAPDLQEFSSHYLQFGELKIIQEAKTVYFNNNIIALTSHEFDVLWLLASHAGKVISRELLVKELRGIDYDGLDRSIDIRISRLRKKLQDNPQQPFKIKTIWAKGYLFVADAW